VLNRLLVRETVALRRAETDPDVAIYLEPRHGIPGHFYLVVRNVGQGPAYGVTFRLEPATQPDDASLLRRIAFLRDGIKYLAPDQDLRSWIGNYEELVDDPVES
jgi:hypothetical protein